MARQKASKEDVQRNILNYYETDAYTDSGDKIRVRVPIPRKSDWMEPMPDETGKIPQFVNISGTVFQFSAQDQMTIQVAPFGVIRGYQWADKAEPNKAWGPFPPFIERKAKNEGSAAEPDWRYDEDYLLTEKQVLDEIQKIKSPEFGRKRLNMWLENAKVQKFDKNGVPKLSTEDLAEDRPKVYGEITKRIQVLEKRWKEIQAEMTGQKKRTGGTVPGLPTT